jgi:hypothetical protein
MLMTRLDPKRVLERYARARGRRMTWEAHWQDCYEFALPQREGALRPGGGGEKKSERLFDATAPDAVDQLAASLMAQLTPPWSSWFAFVPGPDADAGLRHLLAADLERMTRVLQAHFDRSNFVVEMHQCYLDLVTAGTACLMFEEASPGAESAFRFTAVPMAQVVLEEGPSGSLDITFRRSRLPAATVLDRFAQADGAHRLLEIVQQNRDATVPVVEAVVPEGHEYAYLAVAENETAAGGFTVLSEGRFSTSPFINFRWSKAPGESYGRSPVMKALPDIKTANKVVELVLKNASIAVTGIWQVDDDGVINPANIKLVPGTVIPKAVGSAGLTPLEAPGRFDVSELVLDQVRGSIRKALLVDQLGQVGRARMTATEVLERAAETARLLSATYGRLQSELLTPLVVRARMLLARRGEIPELSLDHRIVALEHRSPQARHQAQRDVQNTMIWLDSVRALGPEAMAAVDQAAAARWLAHALGVPGELVRELPDGVAEVIHAAG